FRLAVAAVLVAAGVALVPGKAAAACGDYVHIEGQIVQQQQTTQPPVTDGVPAAPRPCNGPGCSNRPTPPIPPLTAPVVSLTEAKEVAVRHAAPCEADQQSEWTILITPSNRIIRLPS